MSPAGPAARMPVWKPGWNRDGMVSMSDYEAEVEYLMGRYRQKLADLARLQRGVADSSGTAASPRQSVRVTVNGQGEITVLEFPTGAHRWMSAAELSEEILSAARDAKAKAREPLEELLELDLLESLRLQALVQDQVDTAEPGPAEESGRGEDASGHGPGFDLPGS